MSSQPTQVNQAFAFAASACVTCARSFSLFCCFLTLARMMSTDKPAPIARQPNPLRITTRAVSPGDTPPILHDKHHANDELPMAGCACTLCTLQHPEQCHTTTGTVESVCKCYGTRPKVCCCHITHMPCFTTIGSPCTVVLKPAPFVAVTCTPHSVS